MPAFFKIWAVLLLIALWWLAISPATLLRIWLFGLWGAAVFFVLWTIGTYLDE
jgi:multisubunit Na+/H+ antiporter MnhC subunit